MLERNWRLRRVVLSFRKIKPLTICHQLTGYRNCPKKTNKVKQNNNENID